MSQWNGADALNTHMSAISYSTEAQGEGQTDGKIKRSTAGTVCSFFFLAICAAVSVAIGWHFRVKSFEDKEIAKHQFDGRIIKIAADLISVDPVAGTLVLDWSIYKDPSCQPTETERAQNSFDNQTHAACKNSVNIFFDQNLLSQSNGGPGSNPTGDNVPTTPVFVYNATAYTFKYYGNVAAWRTSIALLDSTNGTVIPVRSLQAYPFDRYAVQIFVFAQDAVTNETLGVQSVYTTGISPGFTATAVGNTQDSTLLGINDTLKISRGALVQAYTIIIASSIWMVTLIFLQSTVTIVIFGYPQQEEVLIVPVATLFASTALRETMPGVPDGFDTVVDYVGLLPCLALMAVCAAANIGVMVFVNEPTVHRPNSLAAITRRLILSLRKPPPHPISK